MTLRSFIAKHSANILYQKTNTVSYSSHLSKRFLLVHIYLNLSIETVLNWAQTNDSYIRFYIWERSELVDVNSSLSI